MRVAFLTTQSLQGSTVAGRVLALATHLAHVNEVHVLVLEARGMSRHPPQDLPPSVRIWFTGVEPFERTLAGKRRAAGISLAWRMIRNAWRASRVLARVKPEAVIMVKPLPQNVLALWLSRVFFSPRVIVLDADDDELSAQVLNSPLERVAVRWADRSTVRLADQVVAATPYLVRRYRQRTKGARSVTLIPTGVVWPHGGIAAARPAPPHLLYLGSVSKASGHRVDMLPEILCLVRETIPQATLTIAGTGDDVEALRARFAKLGLEHAVRWTGRFSTVDLQNLIGDTTVLIDPVDAMPANEAKSSFRATLAVAAGLPLVTSAVGIRMLLVPEEWHARFFAPPGDAVSYAVVACDLVKRPLTESERKGLRAHGKQFTWDNLAPSYELLLKHAVN